MPPVFVSEDDFLLQNYTYELPQEQIAQYPPDQRGASRLLTMRRSGALGLEHHMFSDLPDCLPEGALLVANNSRVLQARLLGSRSTGGKVEFLLLTPLPLVRADATPVKGREDTWCAEVSGLIRSGGSVREGETLHFGAGISVTILECGTFGHRRVRMCWKGDVAEAFAATGHIPLPPYIKRSDAEEDFSRYQTIYAREEKTGSVAAPTAGSCGVLPAVLLPLRRRGLADEAAVHRALYIAAGFGQVVAARATLAGAEGGCQAEVGAASGMAAAALVDIKGGTAEQCAEAFAMALTNLEGLVCDPVAGLVEIPCIKRNVIGAMNAVSAADMALAGVVGHIPADEVIDAMAEVGNAMSKDLRETGIGGLAGTPTGRAICEIVTMDNGEEED